MTKLRVPAALRGRVATMLVITDRVTGDHLDAEYRDLARTLLGRLARKRPSPLERGDERVWAGTVLYVLGQLNFLFDPRSTPHMTGDALAAAVDVPQQTLANRPRWSATCSGCSRWTESSRAGSISPTRSRPHSSATPAFVDRSQTAS